MFREKTNAEMRASGIAATCSELDHALEAVIGRKECAEQVNKKTSDGRLIQKEKEKECAEAVRKEHFLRLKQETARKRERIERQV